MTTGTARMRMWGAATAVLLSACGEGGSGTALTDPGVSTSLRITTVTTGPRPDPNGYTLLIDDTGYGTIGANAERVVAATPGSHVVSLDGLAGACSITGTASRTATVTTGQTTPVQFDVECPDSPPETGALRVRVSTTGTVIDPDGYTIETGDSSFAVAATDTLLFGNTVPGTVTVTLRGQAPNCVPDGSAQRPVTIPAGDTAVVTFSLVCLRDPILVERAGAGVDLWAVESDGSVEVNLTEGRGNNRLDLNGAPHATWSADRSRILFISDRDGDWDLYQMNLNKTGLVHFDRAGTQLEPAWSVDGSRILFATQESGDFDVWVMEADGSNPRRVSATPEHERHATWSPDGRVTFIRIDGAFRELWIVNADGTGLQNLSQLPRSGDAIHDYFAYWAPDGATFAFKRIAFNPITHVVSAADIYRMNVDGTGLVNLTNLPARAPDFRLSWNPSGTAIAFTLCGTLKIANCDVHRMSADGSALTPLSAIGGGVDAPSWAPGTDFAGARPAGTEIAFSCLDADGDWEVCVIGADGTGQRKITSNTVPDLVPRWR